MTKLGLVFLTLSLILCPQAFADSIDAFVAKVKNTNLEIASQNSIISAADAKSRGIALKAPMVGGIVTSFILELLIYPVIYDIWKSRELKKQRSLS